MDEVEAVARALAKANRIEICDSAQYAYSSFREPAQAAIAALDAAREDRVAQVVEWLRKENGLCDCHARCETECGCGAWDDWKTKPLLEIADAIERGEPFNG